MDVKEASELRKKLAKRNATFDRHCRAAAGIDPHDASKRQQLQYHKAVAERAAFTILELIGRLAERLEEEAGATQLEKVGPRPNANGPSAVPGGDGQAFIETLSMGGTFNTSISRRR